MKQLFLPQTEPRVYFSPMFERLPLLRKNLSWIDRLNFQGELRVSINEILKECVWVDQEPRGIHLLIPENYGQGEYLLTFTTAIVYNRHPGYGNLPHKGVYIRNGNREIIGEEHKTQLSLSCQEYTLACICMAMATHYSRIAQTSRHNAFWRLYAHHLFRHYSGSNIFSA